MARVAGSGGALGGEVASAAVVVRQTLETVKKAYWPWDWPVGRDSGFQAAARAALGEGGRVGTALAGTVVQPQGARPLPRAPRGGCMSMSRRAKR